MSYETVYCKNQSEVDAIVAKLIQEYPENVLEGFSKSTSYGIAITLRLQSLHDAFAKVRDFLLVDKETGEYFVECAEWDSEMTSGEEYIWHVGLDGCTRKSSPGIVGT